jgi:hydrogenase/urease accessory protein HupE
MLTLARLAVSLLLFACLSAAAHPVAQGKLAIKLLPDAVLIHARVSGEQVFVANTFGAAPAATLEAAWTEHGRYLLDHLRLYADDTLLAGKISAGKPATGDFVEYELQFPLRAVPRQLRLEQNILNEIEYAPGNPWEAAYAVTLQIADGAVQEGFLSTHKQPLQLENHAAVGGRKAAMAKQYVRHGIDHILGGYDHLLFICALVLATVTFWDLVRVIAVFTVAHSITLTLSVLDLVRLPGRIVEPMIAASIICIAVSNVFFPNQSRGKVRLGLAFFFGLFHGLGFAGGLLSAAEGLTGTAIAIAIAAFSLGVEVGHQFIALPLFATLKLAAAQLATDTNRERWSSNVARTISALVAIAGGGYLAAALK